jgi:HAMP domain-containing protein
VLDHVGVVDTPYETVDESAPGRRALARIFALPGGFRLLVGRDLGDRARIGAVMVHAMAVSLVFFAALAALGALFVARRVLRRIDAMNRSARAIMAGDLTLRLPVSGSGDELDRLAAGLNDMLARIAESDDGPARSLRQHRPRPAHAADPAAQSRRGGAAQRRRSRRLSHRARTHDRGIGRPDPRLQRAAGDRARRGGRRRRRHERVRPRRGGRERRRALRAGRRGERRDAEESRRRKA